MKRADLPEGYHLKYLFDFRNNGKLLLLLNFGTLAVMVVMIFLMHQKIPFTMALEGDYTIAQRLCVPLSLLVFLFLCAHIRALIRFFFYKGISGQKPKYNLRVFSASPGLPNYFLDKKSMYLVAAAPVLLLGVVLAVILIVLGGGAWFWVVYLLETVNVAVGVKDVYIIMTVKDMPDEACLLAEGMTIKGYWPEGAKWKTKEE